LLAISGLLVVCPGCDRPTSPVSSDERESSAEDPRATGGASADAEEEEGEHAESKDRDDAPSPTSAAIPAAPDQLAAALKAKNPGFSGEVVMQPISPELMAVAINDRHVKDLSPLARQRIGVLDLSRCDADDLAPLEGLPLMELYLEENRRLSDLSALRGMPLQKLYVSHTRVENLGPLRGAPLVELNCLGTRVKDLSPLAESPLQMLWLTDCPVADLSPLRRLPLVSLTVENTKVADISPLAGHPMQRLHIGRTEVTDLTPVGRMQLQRLIFTPSRIKQGMDVVRNLPTLRELGTTFDRRMAPPVFWQLYDEGKLDE
jgi:hypothetical protein